MQELSSCDLAAVVGGDLKDGTCPVTNNTGSTIFAQPEWPLAPPFMEDPRKGAAIAIPSGSGNVRPVPGGIFRIGSDRAICDPGKIAFSYSNRRIYQYPLHHPR
jgi:hypothetical protein